MKVGIISNASFCLPLLQNLTGNQIQASVFSDARIDDPTDFSLISQFCSKFNVTLQIGNINLLYFWLEEEVPDIVVVIGYRQLIDVERLAIVLRSNIYNVHFGPLPDYKGANPVFWQIKNGTENLTVTIHRLSEKFDSGDVVWSKQLKREPYMSFGIANIILSQVVIEGAGYIIWHVIQKKQLPSLPQRENRSKYYKRPQLVDVRICWHNMTAKQVCNLILACNPWNKGAITTLNENEIKIIDAEERADKNKNSVPGTIVAQGEDLLITCASQTVVKVSMFNINGAFIPARFAYLFGLIAGAQFES